MDYSLPMTNLVFYLSGLVHYILINYCFTHTYIHLISCEAKWWNCINVSFHLFLSHHTCPNLSALFHPSAPIIMNKLLVYSWAGAPQDWWQAVATAAAVTAPMSEPNSSPSMGQSSFAGLTTAGNLTSCLSPAASALTNLVVGLDGSLLAADFLPFTSVGDKSKHTIINFFFFNKAWKKN